MAIPRFQPRHDEYLAFGSLDDDDDNDKAVGWIVQTLSGLYIILCADVVVWLQLFTVLPTLGPQSCSVWLMVRYSRGSKMRRHVPFDSEALQRTWELRS